MRSKYGEEDHRLAWETWLETRNYQKTARTLDIFPETMRRWADDDFACADGCPYHGWDKLLEETQELRKTRNKMIAEGNNNVVAHHEEAIRTLQGDDAARNYDIASIKGHPAYKLFRKDEEKIGHLEFLWEKALYQITGVPATPDENMTPCQYEALFKDKGLQLRNMKEGVQALQAIHSMIQELKGKKDPKEKTVEKTSPLAGLSFDDLANLRKIAKQQPQVIIDITAESK